MPPGHGTAAVGDSHPGEVERIKNIEDAIENFISVRKKIEALFSQLCEQFKIRNNYAKSFDGFKTRILAKITALTLVQYINKFIFDRPINNIKNKII